METFRVRHHSMVTIANVLFHGSHMPFHAGLGEPKCIETMFGRYYCISATKYSHKFT